jgi:thioredoxin reductase
MTSAYDIVIFRASFGGVSAALAAPRYGKSVALIDARDSVGGQATVEGLTRWDETAPISSPNMFGSAKHRWETA